MTLSILDKFWSNIGMTALPNDDIDIYKLNLILNHLYFEVLQLIIDKN